MSWESLIRHLGLSRASELLHHNGSCLIANICKKTLGNHLRLQDVCYTCHTLPCSLIFPSKFLQIVFNTSLLNHWKFWLVLRISLLVLVVELVRTLLFSCVTLRLFHTSSGARDGAGGGGFPFGFTGAIPAVPLGFGGGGCIDGADDGPDFVNDGGFTITPSGGGFGLNGAFAGCCTNVGFVCKGGGFGFTGGGIGFEGGGFGSEGGGFGSEAVAVVLLSAERVLKWWVASNWIPRARSWSVPRMTAADRDWVVVEVGQAIREDTMFHAHEHIDACCTPCQSHVSVLTLLTDVTPVLQIRRVEGIVSVAIFPKCKEKLLTLGAEIEQKS
eukprot:2253521-Amphidinium_carterae.3